MNNDALNTIKQAILMEAKGKSLYLEVAAKTESQDVRDIFETMAAEEQTHIDYLSEQYKSFTSKGTFLKQTFKTENEENIANLVLNPDIKNQISAADFEAAAISAAINMEKKAIEVYSDFAKKSNNEEEKALFTWLAEWENSHLELLVKLDKELTEKIWFDNKFWPF